MIRIRRAFCQRRTYLCDIRGIFQLLPTLLLTFQMVLVNLTVIFEPKGSVLLTWESWECTTLKRTSFESQEDQAKDSDESVSDRRFQEFEGGKVLCWAHQELA